MEITNEQLWDRMEALEKKMNGYTSEFITVEREQRMINDFNALKNDLDEHQKKDELRHETMDNFLWKDSDSINTRINGISVKQEEAMKHSIRTGRTNIALNSLILALIGIMLTAQLNNKQKEITYLPLSQQGTLYYQINQPPSNGTNNIPNIPSVEYPNKVGIIPVNPDTKKK